jgi:hypothetical protein
VACSDPHTALPPDRSYSATNHTQSASVQLLVRLGHGVTNYVNLLDRLDRWRHANREALCVVTFNYRRNLLALKPIGLAIVGLLTIGDGVAASIRFRAAALVALAVNLLVGLAWLTVVNNDWFHEAGQTYAERLFETLEQDRLTNP